jgi:hypothetical protein
VQLREKERELAKRMAAELMRLRSEAKRKDGLAMQAIKQIKSQTEILSRPEVRKIYRGGGREGLSPWLDSSIFDRRHGA